ncbi:oligosaccharide flippase family protein [Xenorhabdus sp. XENO-10]|uniref:Oligosaccharide flippase family protein n=1 Tax=Xenorhabdus yunnanensis TaxID=3025878 RepID=A0ABT5LDN2_9GAMM|nr:oligosaccharide flippase family protein [Xenorhabdus yunnanensis]MDC9588583.1 oligosaccharide flippase family protein [Xenorhabdus yunnanensis]
MNKKKEILRNLLTLSMVHVLGLIIPIITMPILSRAMGADIYGKYLLFLTIIVFGHTIIDYGAQYTGVRDISKNKNNKNRIKIIYTKNQSVRLLLSIIYSLLAVIYSHCFLETILTKWLIYYAIPYFLGYVLVCFWFFQGLSKTQYILYISLFGKIVNLLAILLFTNNQNYIKLVMLSTCYPMLLCGLVVFFTLYLKKKYSILKIKGLANQLKDGYNIFIGILAPNFYNAIPTIYLSSISSPLEFAKYIVAIKLCGIITSFQDVLSKAIYPILAREEKNHLYKILWINIIIAAPIILIIIFLGKGIINLFLGSQYNDNIYIYLISISILFVGMANSYSQGYFIPKKLDKEYRNISLRISIISSLLTIILIYFLGLIGGAISLTIARTLFYIDYKITYDKIEKRSNKIGKNQ